MRPEWAKTYGEVAREKFVKIIGDEINDMDGKCEPVPNNYNTYVELIEEETQVRYKGLHT